MKYNSCWDDIASIFKVFLNRNIPDDSEFLLTILNGKLYRTSPRALPVPLKLDSDLLKCFVQLNKSKRGEKQTSIGTILYISEPINRGNDRSLFVVAHLTTGERREVDKAISRYPSYSCHYRCSFGFSLDRKSVV